MHLPLRFYKRFYKIVQSAFVYLSLVVLLFSSTAPVAFASDIFLLQQFARRPAVDDSRQDLKWGVLAMNFNKSVYSVGETARFEFGVLDEFGEMVCDADLELKIYNLETSNLTVLRTKAGDITVNPECKIKARVNRPDYESDFKIINAGLHRLTLTVRTKNGTRTVADSFYATQENILLDISRESNTRLYPVEVYDMKIKVTANVDFDGSILEAVPESFTLLGKPKNSRQDAFENLKLSVGIQTQTELLPITVLEREKNKYLNFPLKLLAGESTVLSYSFDAPDISPEYYLLGPFSLSQAGVPNPIYQEPRAWQLANDASVTMSPTTATTTNALTCPGRTADDMAWSNPGNATSSDDRYIIVTSEAAYDSGNISDELAFSGFVFALPTGAVIVGIVAEVENYSSDGSNISMSDINLTKAHGNQIGNNYGYGTAGTPVWPKTTDTNTYESFGTSTTDMWGTTWSEAEVEASGFGVALCARSGSANAAAQIDHVRITVYYNSPQTLSGNVYSDEGVTGLANSRTIKLKVDGGSLYSTTTVASTGQFDFLSVTGTDSSILTVFLDGATEDAVTVSVATSSQSSITGFNLYQNYLIIRNEATNGSATTTNANLGAYDWDDDPDIPFESDSNNLTATSSTHVLVWTGKIYDPGGTLTTQSSSNFIVATSSTAYLDTASNSIGGDIYIYGSATTTIQASTTVSGGDIQTRNGSVLTYSGTPTITLAGSGQLGGGTSALSFFNLTGSGSGTINASSSLIISNTFEAGLKTWNLFATAAPLTVLGAFTASSSTISYQSVATTTIVAGNYYNLEFNPATGTPTFIIPDSQNFVIATDTVESSIYSMVFDSTNGAIYAGSNSQGIIYKCIASTGCVSAGNWAAATDTVESNIYSMVFDSTNGAIYSGSGANGRIHKCVVSTGCTSAGNWALATDTVETNIYSMVFDSTNGAIYAGSNGQGIIYKCVASTGCTSAGNWTTATDTPELAIASMVFDSTNGAIYAGASTTGQIYKCATYTGCTAPGTWQVSTDTPETSISAMVFDSGNGTLYAGSATAGLIYKKATNTPLNIANNLTLNGQGTTTLDALFSKAAVAVTGTFLINSGDAFLAPPTTTISGNFVIAGTFVHNTSTVFFAPVATTTITASSSVIFYNVTATSTGKELRFGASVDGSTPLFTIASNFSITGGASRIIIRSDMLGTRWLVHFNSTQSNVTNVFVMDSGCTATSALVSNTGNVNLGNNAFCWGFATSSGTTGAGDGSGGGPTQVGGGSGGTGSGEGSGSGGGGSQSGGGSGGGGGETP